jgi:hypothetical protein
MLTTDITYGITCDVCDTRLDLATRGITETDPATVRRLAQRLEWVTFTWADRDVCRSCATSEVGRRAISAFADDADADSEGGDANTTGPRIAPSENPGSEPAEIRPSGEPVPDGTEPEFERQNSDEPAPGEPREVPGGSEDQPEESERDSARLEGAAV